MKINEPLERGKRFVIGLDELSAADLPLAGGKNASLGEMIRQLEPEGVKVPEGFAITAHAYRAFIAENNLHDRLYALFSGLDGKNSDSVNRVAHEAQELILSGILPEATVKGVQTAYRKMSERFGENAGVAVRSSATAEDLPNASFAGLHRSFLNISGEAGLLEATRRCYASLFTPRAIQYREHKGFGHTDIALSVGVQRMIRADKGCSGICFTLEPGSGFRDVIHIAACWGLGENIVQGSVNPDEVLVYKKSFEAGKDAIISRKLGSKAMTMVYAPAAAGQTGDTVLNKETPAARRSKFCLTDSEIYNLAHWCLMIEKHYGVPMDIEWAKDGLTHEIYIVQARPETAHSAEPNPVVIQYELKEHGKALVTGMAVGQKIASGTACVLRTPAEAGRLKDGEVLVTDHTNPDWDPVMKKAAAIVTNKGGRTSHASIVARELGAAAVVGANNATEIIHDGQTVTVSCAEGQEGRVYDGALQWTEKKIDYRRVMLPRTHAMLILADPSQAFHRAVMPSHGIGLLRLEFAIAGDIGIHPMALVNYEHLKDRKAKRKISLLTRGYRDKKEYFIDKLSQAVAVTAAAFFPREVIVRMSDFKTNEYANLIGGSAFEPEEENPMIGFRGASRFDHERYREGFRLECLAMKRVRDNMGLTNVKLMIPFCRTVEEGRRVTNLMSQFGLQRGVNGLEIYLMVEIPSNVLLLDEFAEFFDGFSIGSNDLTQLTLGIDRDSSLTSGLFDERNKATQILIGQAVQTARKLNKKIGLCGQAPSDWPDYAAFLIGLGINSISFTTDALMGGIDNMNRAESIERAGKDYVPI